MTITSVPAIMSMLSVAFLTASTSATCSSRVISAAAACFCIFSSRCACCSISWRMLGTTSPSLAIFFKSGDLITSFVMTSHARRPTSCANAFVATNRRSPPPIVIVTCEWKSASGCTMSASTTRGTAAKFASVLVSFLLFTALRRISTASLLYVSKSVTSSSFACLPSRMNGRIAWSAFAAFTTVSTCDLLFSFKASIALASARFWSSTFPQTSSSRWTSIDFDAARSAEPGAAVSAFCAWMPASRALRLFLIVRFPPAGTSILSWARLASPRPVSR
mmetsp:Transcript_6990/g.25713  ORF Transcript_6990/g.25713 Transcript_6990/m.25713 type:complete len:277 (+) Transcript_6990:2901-3731(+)